MTKEEYLERLEILKLRCNEKNKEKYLEILKKKRIKTERGKL